MALRSTVDIDLNDEKFKQFTELFEKYREGLSKMPGAWAGVDKHMKSSFESVAAALLAQQELVKRTAKEEADLEKRSVKTSSSWRDMAKSTKTVAGNIKDATLSLLKWSSLTGLISGLVGVGGLFGLDALAVSVGDKRRASMGLGVTIGEKEAFETNFGRVVDTSSFLSSVNESLTDMSKRYRLYNAGLTDRDLAGKDTAQVSVALLDKLKQLADRTPKELLGTTLSASHLDQAIDLQSFQRLKGIGGEEYEKYKQKWLQDQGGLNINDATARKWQDFMVQLDRAGRQIENIFVVSLEGIVGPLDKFSEAIVDSAKTFLGSAGFKQLVRDAGEVIEGFTKDIEDGDFQKNLKEFASNVGDVAKGLYNALQWLGLIPQKAPAAVAKQGFTEPNQGFGRPTIFTKPGTTLPSDQPDYHWYNPGTWFNTTTQADRDRTAADQQRNVAIGRELDRRVNSLNGAAPTKMDEKSVQDYLKKAFPGTRITGGARTAERNAQLEGSARNSMHITGQAVDLVLPKGMSFEQFRDALKAAHFPYTQLLNEGRHGSQGPHVHVGWRPKEGGVRQPKPQPQKVAITVHNNTGGNAIINSSQLGALG